MIFLKYQHYLDRVNAMALRRWRDSVEKGSLEYILGVNGRSGQFYFCHSIYGAAPLFYKADR